ncbi:MAG: hypothetical protein WC464_04180 [Bdellovibrionales bacterium]
MINLTDIVCKLAWPDLVGILGVVISVYYYARVQWHREFAKRMAYSMGNFVGSLMIIYSLMYDWNIAAFMCNIVWGLISLYGVYRCFKYSWFERKAREQVRGG